MKKSFIVISFIILSALCIYAQTDNFLEVENGVLHYKIYGEGNPVLIINGGPGMNCGGFSSLAELLADSNEVILFDQRGTGQSKLNTVDSTTVTMDLMVDDMEKLREHLGFEKWTVLGHSFGGFLAQYYASHYPDSFRGMILSGSGGIDLELLSYFGANMNIRLSEQEKDSLNYWNEQIKQGDTSYTAKYNRGKCLAPIYLYSREYIPLIAERLTQGNSQITDLVYKDLYKINYDCKKSLKHFSKPVLIIQGRQDIVGEGTAYKAHQILENSDLVFLNECGHYGWLEQEEKYKQAVSSFLDAVKELPDEKDEMNIQRKRKSH